MFSSSFRIQTANIQVQINKYDKKNDIEICRSCTYRTKLNTNTQAIDIYRHVSYYILPLLLKLIRICSLACEYILLVTFNLGKPENVQQISLNIVQRLLLLSNLHFISTKTRVLRVWWLRHIDEPILCIDVLVCSFLNWIDTQLTWYWLPIGQIVDMVYWL